MTGSRGTSPETRQNETTCPLHTHPVHRKQDLLAQNIVSNRSTTLTNFWFESLIPFHNSFFNKHRSIIAMPARSHLLRPFREDSPIKSDHCREDREIVDFKHYDAHHRQTEAAQEQIQRGERVTGIGN